MLLIYWKVLVRNNNATHQRQFSVALLYLQTPVVVIAMLLLLFVVDVTVVVELLLMFWVVVLSLNFSKMFKDLSQLFPLVVVLVLLLRDVDVDVKLLLLNLVVWLLLKFLASDVLLACYFKTKLEIVSVIDCFLCSVVLLAMNTIKNELSLAFLESHIFKNKLL